ncbi:MAG: hypothetical protein J5825_06095 [Lachnospiraceae bacterium]|nr:hypothetical protein [Lachnospiraceae bacterium]
MDQNNITTNTSDTKNIPQKKSRKHMGMPAIILVSLIFSFCVNGAYLLFESAFVLFAKRLPFYRMRYGGDCIMYEGAYWWILSPEPMSSPEHPVAASTPRFSFSFLMLLICVAVLAVVAWLVLSLVNRYFKTVLITVGSAAVITLSVYGGKKAYSKWEDTPVELKTITICTADIHPDVYHSMDYPSRATYLVPAGDGVTYGYSEAVSMKSSASITDPKNVTKKQLKALLASAKELKEHTNTGSKDGFAYKVVITYRKNKGSGRYQINGYGSFPEEWSGFIRLVNETCGTDYLREDPEAVTFSEEWFSETYGVCSDTLPEGGTMEGFINSQRIGMERLSDIGISGIFIPFEAADNIGYYRELIAKEKEAESEENSEAEETPEAKVEAY